MWAQKRARTLSLGTLSVAEVGFFQDRFFPFGFRLLRLRHGYSGGTRRAMEDGLPH